MLSSICIAREDGTLPKADLGVKRQCLSCAAKFYDMNKDPIVCPACGATFEPAATKAKSSGRDKPARKAAAPVPEAEAEELDAPGADEEDDDLLDDDDDDLDDDDSGLKKRPADDLMEDASDLGEDDDDMAEVMEHMESDNDDI